MLAVEKEKQCFDLLVGEITLWLILYYSQSHNKMYSGTSKVCLPTAH